jgi:alkylated DNA nucleotide flippase Atl1
MLHHVLCGLEGATRQAGGSLSVSSTHIQLALHRVPQDDRITRDYLETALVMLDGAQRELLNAEQTAAAASETIAAA